ncbi:MAG: hypothetical protein ACRES9_10665, partial [Gammaproteobacteria bacterium]
MFDRTGFRLAIPLLLALTLGLAACGNKAAAAAPGVSAGPDQVVVGSRSVLLSATSNADDRGWSLAPKTAANGSSNGASPNAGEPRYHWSLVAKPVASKRTSADIVDSNSAIARFTPDVAGVYRLRVVLDTGKGKASDTVKVTSKLAISAGGDRSVSGGGPIALHASSNAAHPDYRWQFVSKPAGSKAVITAPTSASAAFTP